MRRRRFAKSRVAEALSQYQPQCGQKFETGIRSGISDRLPTACCRDRRTGLWGGPARSLFWLRLRSHISLALLGALLVALLSVNPAHAEQNEYGSIAYSESTAIATVGFAGSIGDAALAAAEQCRAQSGAQDCAAYLWFYQGYGALARSSNGHFGTGWGTDAQWADTYAIQTCQEYGGDNCQVVFQTQSPGVAGESPSAKGGVFETPISPPSLPTYDPPTYDPPTYDPPSYDPPPTYQFPPTYDPPTLPAPSSVIVPNLIGLSLDDARRVLPQGLELGMMSGNDGTVVDQQPRAGDLVPRYTRVNLVLSAPGFPVWLAVLAVFAVLGVGLALLTARVLRHRTERQRWESRIRVEPAPDLKPTIRLWEPDRVPRFTVRVEVRPDRGVQSVREVVSR